jgi:uncharacterized protein
MKSNLATISKIYEAFGKGDIPFILENLDENVQWEKWADNSAQKAGVPWMKMQKGKAGVAAFFQTIGALKIKDFSVLSIMGNETQVAVEFVIEADVPATGKHYRDEEMHLWTFNQQGKITRLRHYLDTAKHLIAANKSV